MWKIYTDVLCASVDGGDVPPNLLCFIAGLNNTVSLQARLPNVWSYPVIHSNSQWFVEVAGSRSTDSARWQPARAVSIKILNID